MRSWTREEKKAIVAEYRAAARGTKMNVLVAHQIHRSYIYRWEAREATLRAVEHIRETSMSKVVRLEDHPLLQPRKPKPGFVRYVHTWDEIVEMIEKIQAPCAPGAESAEAAEAIIAAVGRSRYYEVKKSMRPARKAPVAIQAAVPQRARRAHTHGAWCRRCSGPVADGSGYCGEC